MRYIKNFLLSLFVINAYAGFGNYPFPFISIVYKNPNDITLLVAETVKENAVRSHISIGTHDDPIWTFDKNEGAFLPPLCITVFQIKAIDNFTFKVGDQEYHAKIPNAQNLKIGFLKINENASIPSKMEKHFHDCNLLINITNEEDDDNELFDEKLSLSELKENMLNKYAFQASTNKFMHNLFATTPMIYSCQESSVDIGLKFIHQLFCFHAQPTAKDLSTEFWFNARLTEQDLRSMEEEKDDKLLSPATQNNYLKISQLYNNRSSKYNAITCLDINCLDNITLKPKEHYIPNAFDTLFVVSKSPVTALLKFFYSQNVHLQLAELLKHNITIKNPWIESKAGLLFHVLFNILTKICDHLILIDCDSNDTNTYNIIYDNKEINVIHSISINPTNDELLSSRPIDKLKTYNISTDNASSSFVIEKLHESFTNISSAFVTFSNAKGLNLLVEDPKNYKQSFLNSIEPLTLPIVPLTQPTNPKRDDDTHYGFTGTIGWGAH